LSRDHPKDRTGFVKRSLRIILYMTAAWACLSAPLSASEPQGEQTALEGKPVLSLAVVSPRGFSSQDVQQITGIKIGESYSATLVRQGLERLYMTGNFRDVLVDTELKEGGVNITFTLVDKPAISEIRLKGNSTYSSIELQRAMQLRVGDEFTNEAWKSALARLVSFYRRQGFLQARIVSETSTIEKETRLVLAAEIQEGKRARVREVQFYGDSAFPVEKLKTVLKTTPGGSYQTNEIEDDLKALDHFYVRQGYLRATIGPPIITYNENANEVVIRLPVDAGVQLKVVFEGNTHFPVEVLKERLLVWEERSYDPGVLEESAKSLEAFYQTKGYLFAKVEQQFIDRTEKFGPGVVVVKFKIKEGGRITINKIAIRGNRVISEQEIKKLMRTKESGLFTSTVLNRARLNGDKTIILNFYRSKGYLEAGIEEAISFNKDQSEMNIILHIKEGSQVIVRKILFDGNTVLSDQDLRKNIVLAEGMPYNEDQTRLDRFNLLAIYAQNGFLSTQIDVKPSITDDKQGIKLVYRIQER
jgi:outer membrane protein assembly factor BamA